MKAPLIRESHKPIRLVHLGLGAFFRAHQARFTQQASDADEWGYAAFTVRSSKQADLLESQHGLYTLTETSADGEVTDVVDQVSAAYAGDDIEALCAVVADPAVAVITLTITEGGYSAAHAPDAAETRVDAARAQAWTPGGVAPESPLARLVVALDARRRNDGGPVAVMSCDNLPENGMLTHRALIAYAAGLAETAAWIDANVAFCSTTVDRITPRMSEEDQIHLASRINFTDVSPVVTERYAEWVIQGEFPAGRPDWESAGALVTDDVRPFEMRKLRLLNGAHTLLAIAGLRRGFTTVDAAIDAPELLDAVERWWAVAGTTLPPGLDAAGYAAALRVRFANPALRHQLTQIAENMVVKLRSRILPVLDELGDRHLDAVLWVLAEWTVAVEEGFLPNELGIDDEVDRVIALEGRLDRLRVAAAVSAADRTSNTSLTH